MTKVMIALAMLLLGIVTLGMSQKSVADDPVVVYEQGLNLLFGRNGVEKNSPAAIEKFEVLADQGWAIAQHRLGEIYSVGNGVPRSLVRAYVWYQRAAGQGYPPARDELARISKEMTTRELDTAKDAADSGVLAHNGLES